MKVYGALEVAQLEWFTDAGKPSATGNAQRIIYTTDLKQVLVSDGTTWNPVGSTGGTKNYFSSSNANPGFEGGTVSPWSAFTTVYASGVPTTVTLSSTQTTLSRTTTNPLTGAATGQLVKNAANAQGQGFISGIITIDREDLAKVLFGQFAYEVVSGTVDMSGTSTQSFEIWVYNVVSGVWTQPSGYRGMNQSSGQGKSTFNFQTDSTVANNQYRIAIILAQTDSNAMTVNFDDFQLGPQALVLGVPMSDWVSSTFVTANTSGFGTITSAVYKSRRVGDSLEVSCSFVSGTATAVQAQIQALFNSVAMTVDTAKIGTSALVGKATISTFGTTYFGGATLAPSANQNYVNIGLQQSTTSEQVAVNGSSIAAAGNGVELFFVVPIVGWSSNVQFSSDSDTRVVAVIATGSATTIGTGVTTITPTTISNDSHGAFSGSTYTVPVSGYYRVDVFSAGSVQAYATGTYNVYVRQAGSITNDYQVGSNRVQAASSVALASSGSTIIFCKAGDTLQFGALSAIATVSSAFTGSIQRLSGPSVVANTESVNGLYSTLSSTTITAGTALSYTTKVKDSHNAYSGGILTIPVSGTYSFSGGETFLSASTSDYQLSINGSVVRTPATMNSSRVSFSIDYPVNAGDLVRIVPASSVTAGSTGGYFSWKRVGN